jgi:CHAT domain-containing protein
MAASQDGADASRGAMRDIVFPPLEAIWADPFAMFPRGPEWDPVRLATLLALRSHYGDLWDPLSSRRLERGVYDQFVERLVGVWTADAPPDAVWPHVEVLVGKSEFHGQHRLAARWIEVFLAWHGRAIQGSDLHDEVIAKLGRARLREGRTAEATELFRRLAEEINATLAQEPVERAFALFGLASEQDIPETPLPGLAAFKALQRELVPLEGTDPLIRSLRFGAGLRLLRLADRAEDRWTFATVLAEMEPIARELEVSPPERDGTRFHSQWLELAKAKILVSLGRAPAATTVAEAAAGQLDTEMPLRQWTLEEFGKIRQFLEAVESPEVFQRRQSASDLLGQYYAVAGQAAMANADWPRAAGLLERAVHHIQVTDSICAGEEYVRRIQELARASLLAGRRDEAVAWEQEFSACSAAIADDSELRATGLLTQAEMLEASGDLYHAEFAARRALAILQAQRSLSEREVLRGRVLLSRIALRTGRAGIAADEAEAALRSVEGRDRFRLSEAEFQALEALAGSLVDDARGARRLLDVAYRALQARRNSHAQAALEIAADRAAAGINEGDEIARRLAELRYQLRSLDHDFRALAFTPAQADALARRTRLESERTEVEAAATALGARLPARLRDLAADAAVATSSPELLKGALRAGEVILDYAVTERGVFLTLITPDNIVGPRRLAAGSATVGELVGHIRTSLSEGKDFNAAAGSLYDILLRPVEATVAPARRVYLVADDPLARLPFHLLVTDSASSGRPDTHRRAAWWLSDQRTLVTLPGPSALLRAAPRRTMPVAERVLAVTPYESQDISAFKAILGSAPEQTRSAISLRGTPVVAPDMALRARIAALPHLNHAAEEVREISATFGSLATTLIGRDATKSRLSSLTLPEFRMIFIAAHTLPPMPEAGQDEPGIVLFPPESPSSEDNGLLTPSEIALLDLDADLVVLSACDTSLGRAGDPQTLNGLARGFLAAKARALVVSHWPVDSASSAELISLMARALKDGADPDKALNSAIRTLQQAGAPPSHWAPFVLVTSGRDPER